MRIAYVLPYPELNGGNKVIFQHVRLLQESGDEVTVLAEGPRPDWIRIDAAYQDCTAAPPVLQEQDLVIATFWTTIPIARRLGIGPVAHFCQGYEGGLVHLEPFLPRIEEVYSWRLPTLTVAPHLADLLKSRFGRESRVVPPPLDPLFRPSRIFRLRLRPRRRPWVAIPGIFAAEVKGVPTALAAVRRLRESGLDCRVLRFSILPLSDEERRLLEPDAYLCGVHPRKIARALRHCDLLLFPSRAEEGFGLPLLEAMASGLPAVASLIPSTVRMAGEAAPLVPADDPEAFATAARELLGDTRAWRHARVRGLEATRGYRPEIVASRLAEAVRWAADHALHNPPEPMPPV